MTVHLSIDARVDVDAHSGRDGSAATSSSSSSSSSPKSPPSLPPIDILFVWDFDWTIVDCNSDEYVPAQFLGTEEMERRLRRYVDSRGPTRWHECVSDVVNECVEECDLSTPGDVRAAAARMPYLADVRGAIEDVGGRGKEGESSSSSSSSSFSSSCYGQAIISDGNDCFIKAFLNENGMGGHFTHGIETNMGRWEESRGGGTTEVDDSSSTGGGTGGGEGHRLLFRVVHQSSKYGGHTDITCPPNLCKTQVLLDILSRITTTTSKTSGGGGGEAASRVRRGRVQRRVSRVTRIGRARRAPGEDRTEDARTQFEIGGSARRRRRRRARCDRGRRRIRHPAGDRKQDDEAGGGVGAPVSRPRVEYGKAASLPRRGYIERRIDDGGRINLLGGGRWLK